MRNTDTRRSDYGPWLTIVLVVLTTAVLLLIRAGCRGTPPAKDEPAAGSLSPAVESGGSGGPMAQVPSTCVGLPPAANVCAVESRGSGRTPALTAQTYIVTAYCPCRQCCGPNARGITASGKRVRVGMCAADRRVPFGTVFVISGYGRAVVEDRGGAIKGNRIDVFFETHDEALRWGRRTVKVTKP